MPLIDLILDRQPEFAVWAVRATGQSWEELAAAFPEAAKKPA